MNASVVIEWKDIKMSLIKTVMSKFHNLRFWSTGTGQITVIGKFLRARFTMIDNKNCECEYWTELDHIKFTADLAECVERVHNVAFPK